METQECRMEEVATIRVVRAREYNVQPWSGHGVYLLYTKGKYDSWQREQFVSRNIIQKAAIE